MKTTSSICGHINLHLDGLLTSLHRGNLNNDNLKYLPITVYIYTYSFDIDQR